MTRKHFEALASRLAERRPHPTDTERLAGWREGVGAVADVCQDANPRFDRERFIDAAETR